MGKIKSQIINRFDGGVSDDIRQSSSNAFGISRHFDIFSSPNRLIPYKDMEVAYADENTDRFQSFCVAEWNDKNNKLFALGVLPATGIASIQYFSPFDDPSVTIPANGFDSSGATNFELFIHYKGKLFGAAANARIWSYDFATTTFTSAYQTFAYTNISQGLVHSQSDTLYIPHDNIISSLNVSTWKEIALVLPTKYIITSLCEYGSYLAILCRPKSKGAESSKIFLWDLGSENVSDVIDVGAGDSYIIENIDNTLVIVSQYTAVSSSFKSYLVLSRYSGGAVEQFKKIPMYFTATSLTVKQKINGRLYFNVNAGSTPTTKDYTGVWVVGKNTLGQFIVTLDRLPVNDQSTISQIVGFILVQDFMYIAYINTSNAYVLVKTNDQSLYTFTSSYESQIFTYGDQSNNKELNGVACFVSPLSSGQVFTMGYKRDQETSFTQIFSENTVGLVSREAINVESTGVDFDQFAEVSFNITSTGGAEITGFKHQAEELLGLIL